jgi:hypothetical protein
MCGSQFIRPARRVQRIRQQEKSVHKVRILGRCHRGLTAAIGMAAGQQASSNQTSERFNRGNDALTILRCTSWAGRT